MLRRVLTRYSLSACTLSVLLGTWVGISGEEAVATVKNYDLADMLSVFQNFAPPHLIPGLPAPSGRHSGVPPQALVQASFSPEVSAKLLGQSEFQDMTWSLRGDSSTQDIVEKRLADLRHQRHTAVSLEISIFSGDIRHVDHVIPTNLTWNESDGSRSTILSSARWTEWVSQLTDQVPQKIPELTLYDGQIASNAVLKQITITELSPPQGDGQLHTSLQSVNVGDGFAARALVFGEAEPLVHLDLWHQYAFLSCLSNLNLGPDEQATPTPIPQIATHTDHVQSLLTADSVLLIVAKPWIDESQRVRAEVMAVKVAFIPVDSPSPVKSSVRPNL